MDLHGKYVFHVLINKFRKTVSLILERHPHPSKETRPDVSTFDLHDHWSVEIGP